MALETKQTGIIKHDEAEEQKNNAALKKKISSLNHVQLKNSGDIVKDVH